MKANDVWSAQLGVQVTNIQRASWSSHRTRALGVIARE